MFGDGGEIAGGRFFFGDVDVCELRRGRLLMRKALIKYFSACLMLAFLIGVIIWARVVTLYSRMRHMRLVEK